MNETYISNKEMFKLIKKYGIKTEYEKDMTKNVKYNLKVNEYDFLLHEKTIHLDNQNDFLGIIYDDGSYTNIYSEDVYTESIKALQNIYLKDKLESTLTTKNNIKRSKI